MIPQMMTLLRVKELKQDQAFRAMRAKRSQVEDAKTVTERAQVVVEQSAATMPAREDAIYAGVIGRVVDLNEIDETRGRVVQLEKDHSRLKDAWERARHVEARLEKELESATDVYRQSTKVRDKYAILTDMLKREVEEIANQREEAEVEDLFARPRQGPS
jgi:phosphosulfolactate phosphohydrolase-like enzyme